MKRWIPILVTAMAMTLLPGCQSQKETEKVEEAEPIEAMYIQKGDDFKLFVNTASDLPFTANIPEGTEDLTTGDLVKIYGNGIMLESYPGQYPGVTRIEVTAQGEEKDAEKYQSILDEIYQEPDPAEPPYLNLEYRTELASVSAVTNRGGVNWTYEDEEGKTQGYVVDTAFILDWKELNDIRLSEPTDVYLHFSEDVKSVEVIRYQRSLSDGKDEEPKGEKVDLSRSDDPEGQYVIKELSDVGVYLVKAEFEQGTVEYGFEVLEARKE